MKLKTLADLKRIPIGTKLRIVRCLIGPVAPEKQARTVAKVQSNAIAFQRPDKAELSWLTFPKASEFEPTENGFRVLERDPEGKGETDRVVVAAEYVFGPEVAP